MSSKYYLTSFVASDLISAIQKQNTGLEVSLDLNLTQSVVRIQEKGVVFDDLNHLSINALNYIRKKENRVFILQNNELAPLEIAGSNYYKLVPTKNAPTIEIDGIRMHRTKDWDPFEDARVKAEAVVSPGSKVLDTCGGLGYTAIWSKKLGAASVISIEKNPNVRKIRKENPWSQALFQKGITLMSGDSYEMVPTFQWGAFDVVIHDPPRFSTAGELYSIAFYKQLHRVLRRGGEIFHYTGNPHQMRKGSQFMKNTMKRLKEAGFESVALREDILGMTAKKKK